MADQIDVGDVVRIDFSIRDAETGALTDPTALYFRAITPNDVRTVYTYGVDTTVLYRNADTTDPVAPGAAHGVFYALVPATEGGIWAWKAWSTGVGTGAFGGTYYVVPDR